MDPNAKDSLVARLKEATNVLVTVSNNPTVDQLAACIGFTLLLNKVGKRGAAVFSGDVPSTLEFLQPDNTLEKNTDSLRDFIIALDKSKADKLRYKVEDTVVKIFITPYRTSISDKDLDFSQGDFNVDVVLALGVHQKADLDQAIVAHGRILHDATVISVNNKDQGSLGTINWVDLQASSLSEMMALVGQELSHEAFDNQIATALMTGIVAETDRFSNEKTSPATMKLASELMGAGANQQLIANKLDAPTAVSTVKKPSETDDGELTIEHEAEKPVQPVVPEIDLPEPNDSDDALTMDDAEPIDATPPTPPKEENTGPAIDNVRPTSDAPTKPNTMTLEPPTLGGKLTANSVPEHLSLDPSTDPLSAGAPHTDDGSMLSRPSAASLAPLAEPSDAPSSTNDPASDKPVTDSETGEEHEEQIEDAREAVDEAIEVGGDPEKNLEPIQALGAQPVNLNLGHDSAAAPAVEPVTPSFGDTASPSVAPEVTSPASPANGVDPFNSMPTPTGDMSMPPNPTITPPTTPIQVASPQPLQPSMPTPSSDFGPSASQSFVNPSAPTPPSFSPAPPLPNVIDTGSSAVPTNLVPPSAPKDVSGSSGPATPPPPVPPPMMPPMPSQQAMPPVMNNPQPPLPPNQPL
ncbi:hypothetical protein KA047_02745 [Candidatus Saccharibacteria bacterium]|nr:hypothetical protein [Candidatus Saccharibacteria bacterium]